jgi:hypothetical protein
MTKKKSLIRLTTDVCNYLFFFFDFCAEEEEEVGAGMLFNRRRTAGVVHIKLFYSSPPLRKNKLPCLFPPRTFCTVKYMRAKLIP